MMKFDFSKWLKNELELAEWKQADLAAATGITRAAICKYISGEMKPQLDTFMVILDALDKHMEIRDNACNDDDLRVMFKRCRVLTRGTICKNCTLRDKCEHTIKGGGD